MLTIILGSIVGLVIGSYHLYLRLQNSNLKKELALSKKRFGIAYDLLWMEVREKNDLTYNDMANLIVSMSETPDYLPAVRETLALRISGKTNRHKQIGF